MTHDYTITGMTCKNCVARVKSEILKLGDVTEANVQLDSPQATITMQKHVPLAQLQEALSKAGHYTITEEKSPHHAVTEAGESASWLNTYKPILIIGLFITGITVLIEMSNGQFSLNNWMANFMAGFFLTFSFFKMLDLKGFAESYSTYDIIATKWMGWGYVYAFIELALGLSFLIRFNPLITNAATFVVMSISIAGVLQSVMNKRKIQCACLGTVFNLPMSTVTIIEDALMIVMSATMIVTMI
jgi:cation transport ATPase